MHFREVIERSRLLGEGNGVPAAVVFDADVSFFDVKVGRAVLAHGPELH
jgi:hypothetical protein